MKIGLMSAVSLVLVSLFVMPFLALAQAPTVVDPPTTTGPLTGGEDVVNLTNTFLKWVATIFWIAAAAFIFWAAFLYLTASGDPEKVKKASHALLYGIIAIAVGLMAYGLPQFVENVLSDQ